MNKSEEAQCRHLPPPWGAEERLPGEDVCGNQREHTILGLIELADNRQTGEALPPPIPSPGSPHVRKPCRCHWWLLSPLERRGGKGRRGSPPSPTPVVHSMSLLSLFAPFLETPSLRPSPPGFRPALSLARGSDTSDRLGDSRQIQPSAAVLPGVPGVCPDWGPSAVILPRLYLLTAEPSFLTCPGPVRPEPMVAPAYLGQQVNIDCGAHSPGRPQQQQQGCSRSQHSQSIPLRLHHNPNQQSTRPRTKGGVFRGQLAIRSLACPSRVSPAHTASQAFHPAPLSSYAQWGFSLTNSHAHILAPPLDGSAPEFKVQSRRLQSQHTSSPHSTHTTGQRVPTDNLHLGH